MYIRGDVSHGDSIIKYLCIHGTNPNMCLANNPNNIYFVEDGEIRHKPIEGFSRKYTTWDLISSKEVPWAVKLSNIKDWEPENKHITSVSEVIFLENYFNLYELSKVEMQNLRDMTVFYFSLLSASARENSVDDMLRYITTMQSITAVIDKSILL